jgi:two-component system sensor histidine kinase KdpD
MLVAGASGYVLKDSPGQQILNAVRHAAQGGAVISPGVAPTVIDELNEALERERRRAHELQEAHDQLVEHIAHRHELIARLGHELRTPVTVIYGVARTLAAGSASEAQKGELLARLVSRSSSLVRLVERFETAVDAELTEPIDLAAVAKEVAASASRVAVVAESALPPVPLNPILARRILEELMDNAVRFSPGETAIEVWVGVVGSTVKVKVMDQGPGIDPRDHSRIFEPLEQGEAIDARVHQGAGVGLSLARAAARAMGGDVALEASSPDGSTFLWTIPLEGSGRVQRR